MSKKETTQEKTDFQGAVSLEAILAATKGNTEKPTVTPVVKEEVKKEIEEEVITTVVTEVPTPVKETPATIETQTETEAFKKAKQLIEFGFLDDFSIQTSEEEDSVTPISEFTSMTDENLQEIIKISKQEKDKEISTKYLPKGDLKDHQLKVFEILSNGGDLSQIAETPEKALERPFEGFDLDNRERQMDILYTDLVHQKGLKHERAVALIKLSEQNKTLKEEAQEVFDSYRQAHAGYIDGLLEDQKKEKEFKDLNFKENKKALTAKLKESGLKESVYKKVASEYSKKNDNGDYALIDKLRAALDKPEENHELILHLSDKTLFNETFKIKAAQESQKQIVRLASGASNKGNKQTSKTTNTEVEAPWLKMAQIHNDNIKQ